MRISKKQQAEIEFLSKKLDKVFEPTQAEIEDYIEITVLGKKKLDNPKYSNNRLFQAKRMLDINIKMWRKDLNIIFFKEEAIEEFNHNLFITKIINNLT